MYNAVALMRRVKVGVWSALNRLGYEAACYARQVELYREVEDFFARRTPLSLREAVACSLKLAEPTREHDKAMSSFVAQRKWRMRILVGLNPDAGRAVRAYIPARCPCL